MDFAEKIEKLMPVSPKDDINWKLMEESPLGYFFPGMKKTMQNPEFHGEGNVFIHTQMVCRELVKEPEFWGLSQLQKAGIFAAALLHDIGKIRTTRIEYEKWVSPYHSSTGSMMTREFLWLDCNLCGTKEKIQLRELICALVHHHMLPVHLIDHENPELRAREIASIGELVPDFSWRLLCLLSKADMKGRIAADIDGQLEKIELCQAIAEEGECFDEPYHFQDACAKHAYLSGRNVLPEQMLYDDTWGEVILMSGLPGTGKDTWIQNNIPDYPMISLDEIRKEMNVLPTENQGIVIQKAREMAKVYLREHQPFVWNATDITKDTRQKQIRLFERYGARVKIVYLETVWETQMQRNCHRSAEVPVEAIEKMLRKTVLPVPSEAQLVEWICV